MEHAGFPSDETLAAYIDGRLDARTRRRVIEHIEQCEECYAVVISAAGFRLREGREGETDRPRSSRRWITIALAAALAVALAFVVSPFRTWLRHRRVAGTSLLAESVGEHRHIEPRLAGFPYQSLQAMRGPEELTKNPENWRLVAAVARVQEEASRRRTPATLHALGVSHLLYGNFDEAVATLEQAVELESRTANVRDAIARSNDVQLLTDLTASYEARGAQNTRARDRFEADDAADRAWKLAPRSPEALWNRALAIEGLSMNEDAAAAWDAYLRVDSTSRWAGEAREHLQRLRRPTTSQLWEHERLQLSAAALAGQQDRVDAIVARFPLKARRFGEEELLPAWGRARLDHNDEAARVSLMSARAIGKALDRNSGERMLADCVSAIDKASGRTLDSLAEGHLAYAAGWQRFQQRHTEEAMAELTNAVEKLHEGGSALAAFAQLDRAGCRYMENRYTDAVTELIPIEHGEKDRHHMALCARVEWLRGLIEFHVGHPWEACEQFQRSLDGFARLHEEDNEAAMESQMAEALTTTGETDEALRNELAALAILAKTGSHFRFHRLLITAAQTATQEHYTAAAELLLMRLAAFDAKYSPPDDSCETLFMLGLTRAREGDRAGAADAIRKGEAACRLIPDRAQRDRLSSYALAETVASGIMPIAQTPDSLAHAIGFFESNRNTTVLAKLYAERGELWRQRGRADLAERDFGRSLDALESEHSEAGNGFPDFGSPYDSMLELLLLQHRVADALLIADRANTLRLGSLYAPAPRTQGRPIATAPRMPSAEALQSMLPANVVVVACHATKSRLLIWTVGQGRLDIHEVPIAEDGLQSLAASVSSTVRSSATPEAVKDAGRHAGRLLLQPWIGSIPRSTILVFVPDSVLAPLPFAALVNPATDRFLVQDYPIATNGSIAEFVRCTALDRSRAETLDALFVSPVPALMSPLPFSGREIEDASSFWNPHAVLAGGDVSKTEFLQRSPRAGIIHFAGHARINEQRPLLSALVFPDSLLYAHELSEKSFEHARLFVLAACSTGRQPRPGISFAAVLTAHNVPSVVASLWDADDHSSSVLFTVFHRELRRGASRAEALQRAQLSLLFAGDPDLRKPAAWAGFQVIGAVDPIVQEERKNV